MSTRRSCRFLVVPVDGPARFIHHHPSPEAVSDALGGSLAVPVPVGRPNMCAWVRETCATEGLERNIHAAVLVRVFGGPPLPFLGPVVFTCLAWALATERTHAVSEAAGFSEVLATGLARITTDLRRALDGFDGGFTFAASDPVWGQQVRATGEECRRVPIPEGWPLATYGPDDVGRLMRRLGLGQAFAAVAVQH